MASLTWCLSARSASEPALPPAAPICVVTVARRPRHRRPRSGCSAAALGWRVKEPARNFCHAYSQAISSATSCTRKTRRAVTAGRGGHPNTHTPQQKDADIDLIRKRVDACRTVEVIHLVDLKRREDFSLHVPRRLNSGNRLGLEVLR